MIRRLFCYIEYNEIHKNKEFKPEDYDLLEIGATLYVDDEEAKTYHRYVHPQYMELISQEKYQVFGGLQPIVFEKAAVIEDISRRFYKTFYDYDLLVMWSKKEYEILMASLRRGGHIQAEHKAVFLEEIINVSKGYVKSFKKELKEYKVETDKQRLFVSKYKASYLAQLYFAAKKSYSVFLKREEFLMVKHHKGNVVHTIGCEFAEKISSDKIREARGADLFDGYQLCSKCCAGKMPLLPDRNHVRFPTQKQFEKEQIDKMCMELKLGYSIGENILFIKTLYANWRIFHDNNRVSDVYHENLRVEILDKKRKKGNEFNEGFHKQQLYSRNLYDVLYYIHCHDRKLYIE